MTLFPVEPLSVETPDDRLSAGQRLTVTNNAALARGVHPATRRNLLDSGWGYTCGDCSHAVNMCGGARYYWKCERHRLGTSASAASDIRKSWPACERFGLA